MQFKEAEARGRLPPFIFFLLLLDMKDSLFLRNCAGEVTSEKPVWMMRQAGRYLPEYREMRARFPNFLDFVADAEASAEATVQPIRRFNLDAAILFSDILVTLPPLGLDLSFVSGRGPVVSNPIRTMQEVRSLTAFDSEKALSYTRSAIEKTKQLLPSGTPLLGFVGGPLTIASYAIEGQSSKNLLNTKKLFHSDPSTYKAFLELMATITGKYLALQADWGCDALVIMDSWAGHLSAEDYREMALPYTKTVMEIAKHAGKPIIHYANGASHLLKDVLTLNASAFGVDWRADLPNVLADNPKTIFQGNLDPALLFAPPSEIKRQTTEILNLVKDRAHIMNLGHGVLQGTPIEGVNTFIETIRNY